MKIGIVGQGYVGLNVAVGAAKAGYEVIGIDTNERIVSELISFQTSIPGITSLDLSNLISSKKYFPTSNFQNLEDTSIVVIAVPTPLDKFRKPDLQMLATASTEIGKNLTAPTLIVNESTSYPGTLRTFIKPIIDKESKYSHDYVAAPERIDPGNSKWQLSNTPRVIGGLSKDATQRAVEFYKSFCGEIYEVSSPEVAEAAKLFENTFRQINIALANEFSLIANSLNFSTNEAIQAAATKPFGFMPFFPSIGVGGHCIPVDPSYLSYAATKSGVTANFIELANTTNLSMVRNVIDRIKLTLNKSFSEISVQVAGIAYKPGVSDLRESPALELIMELRNAGANVTWHDPLVKSWNGENSSKLSELIDLGLIVTPHDQIDFSIWKKGRIQVFDLSANSNNYGWKKFL